MTFNKGGGGGLYHFFKIKNACCYDFGDLHTSLYELDMCVCSSKDDLYVKFLLIKNVLSYMQLKLGTKNPEYLDLCSCVLGTRSYMCEDYT